MNKLFIIGLPRTGTTSVSASLLTQGFKVAHTAYTKHTFELADVISDTPCFCDYQQLDQLFPGSKFVYLDRNIESWVPSMQMLLNKILLFMDKKPGKLSPVLQRCFRKIFQMGTAITPLDGDHLRTCYLEHQVQVFDYFSSRDDFLSIDISHGASFNQLLSFIGMTNGGDSVFPHINTGRMINAWQDIKHPNKINSNSSGNDRRKYFDFE